MGFSDDLTRMAKGALKGTPFGGVALGLLDGDGGSAPRRRRMRPIPRAVMADVREIESILGKKAAENYLLARIRS